MKENDPYAFYNRFKNNSHGYCSICNKYGKLTLDHIIPVSCGNTKITLYDFFQRNMTKQLPKGFVLRTICDTCNNVLLAPLDVKLAKICNDFNSYLDSKLHLEGKIQFNDNIEDIKKCVVGHILAGFELPLATSISNTEKNGLLRKVYHNYLTGKTKKLPSNYKIHYWIHKYNSIMFNPCFGIAADIRYKDAFITCSLLKFRPLGFLIVDYKKSICNVDLPFLQSDDPDNFTLQLRKSLYLPDDYPMRPPSNGILLLSNKNLFCGKKYK